MGERKEEVMRKKLNYKCLVKECSRVLGSPQGISSHLLKAHNKKMKINKTYKKTTMAVNGRSIRAQSKVTKRKPIVPQSQYIDVQAIIRIPISLGQAMILSAE
jgi:hypothetical protein